VVNGCRNPTYGLSLLPGEEVGNLGVTMVGVFPGQQSNQTEETITEQVTPQR